LLILLETLSLQGVGPTGRRPVRIKKGDPYISLCMFSKERKECFKEFQIFFPRKSGDALFGIVGFLFFEIRGTCPPPARNALQRKAGGSASPSGEAGGSKKIRSGFSFPLTGHTRLSGFHS